MTLPLFIDFPLKEIETINPVIAGWVAGERDDRTLRILAAGRLVPHFLTERPDVCAAYPHLPYSSGFGAEINMLDLSRPEFEIVVEYGDERTTRRVKVTRQALAEQALERALRDEARRWCIQHIICLSCKDQSATAVPKGKLLVCNRCQTVYPQYADKLDFLPDTMRFALTPRSATTSANPYDPAALDLINTTVAAGGIVLDCGAGFRSARMRNVINFEITAYRSTDVLGLGECLPFKDASFDAILSLAVLEHVRDPFACAREMLRVIKPDGKIMCSVPFLQPEHNFPGHYYNMTQSGLENLFGPQADLVSVEVPLHGHPIFSVQWILRDYLAGLPEPARSIFADMKIGEAAARDPASHLGYDYATQLSQETWRKIACLNTMIFRRSRISISQVDSTSHRED